MSGSVRRRLWGSPIASNTSSNCWLLVVVDNDDDDKAKATLASQEELPKATAKAIPIRPFQDWYLLISKKYY